MAFMMSVTSKLHPWREDGPPQPPKAPGFFRMHVKSRAGMEIMRHEPQVVGTAFKSSTGS